MENKTISPGETNWPHTNDTDSNGTFSQHNLSTNDIPLRRHLTTSESLHLLITERLNYFLAKSRKDYSVTVFIQIMKDGSLTFSRSNFDFSMDKLNLTLYVKPNEINFSKKIVAANIAFLFLKSKLTQMALEPPFIPVSGLPTLCTLFLPPLYYPSVNGRVFENYFLKFFSPADIEENPNQPPFDDFLTPFRPQRSFLDTYSRGDQGKLFPSSRFVMSSLGQSGLL